ncbi:lens intrinsic membrane protein 2.2 isoform X1 [Siphateles boraxobius]|uniref:lens intrinsic membrane protein 2.2 isoform X1 n=1 Tax=Siphateles boraxobius TaxID=180520 RepID=UPI004062ACB4
MSDWMIRSIVAGTITVAARGGFKTPEARGQSVIFAGDCNRQRGGASLCGVAALVLLIISTATDYWMQYRYSGNAANQGLWRFCINRKCHAHTLNVAFWDATRAFMLLSLLGCFAGLLLSVTASKRGRSKRVRAGGVALLLSGFLALLALAIYTGMTVSFFGKRYIGWKFSWSHILGWIGAILALAAGVLQLCAYQRSFSEATPVCLTDES